MCHYFFMSLFILHFCCIMRTCVSREWKLVEKFENFSRIFTCFGVCVYVYLVYVSVEFNIQHILKYLLPVDALLFCNFFHFFLFYFLIDHNVSYHLRQWTIFFLCLFVSIGTSDNIFFSFFFVSPITQISRFPRCHSFDSLEWQILGGAIRKHKVLGSRRKMHFSWKFLINMLYFFFIFC